MILRPCRPLQLSLSTQLFSRAKALIPGGVNSPVRAFRSVGGAPFFTKRAEGAYLHTTEERQLIDFVCTWGPAIHGHNDPTIREAIATALMSGTSFGTPNPYEVEMAELIVSMVPSVEKVRMVNSGTEATMSAIRLARGYTGRNKIIKFAGCYHGHVDSLLVQAGSGALTLGNPDSAGIPPVFAAETIVLPFNDPHALEGAFARYGEDLAAVILEPFPANVGLIFPRSGYLENLRKLCTSHETVLIFDEVMTGFPGRPRGVQEKTGVVPGPDGSGKNHRRRLAGGGFGRKSRDNELFGATGTRLPGRHPERQPAGHGLGHCSPQKTEGGQPLLPSGKVWPANPGRLARQRQSQRNTPPSSPNRKHVLPLFLPFNRNESGPGSGQ